MLRTRKRREAKSLPYGWRYKTGGTYQAAQYTPSAVPMAARQVGEPYETQKMGAIPCFPVRKLLNV